MEPIFDLPAWTALGPALILVVFALFLFVYDSIHPHEPSRGMLAGIATAGSLLSLGLAIAYVIVGIGDPARRGEFHLFGDQLVVDQMALFFLIVIGVVTTLVTISSYDYMSGHTYQAEYYSLVMLAASGMAGMAVSNSLVTIFISLELASLPSYALVSILKSNRGSVEAGLKYFLIGALSSAIFLYGISLVYGATGVLQLDAIAANIDLAEDVPGILGLGILMLIGGFAFKTASVPFHFWAPEAYEGAPAPIAAFLSSASKAAGFVIAFRVFTTSFPLDTTTALIGVDWTIAFVILAIVTMTLGNFAAATQQNVKRMLAYSSVGHAGYALIGLAGLSSTGSNDLVLGAAMMHLMVYGFMNTGAFLFIALAEYWDVGRTFSDYNGLATKAPIACLAMTIFLFSLAGIPPFGGFWSKYFLFTGAISAGLFLVAAALVVNSALSLFYYSRLVKSLWIEEPSFERDTFVQPAGLYVAIIVAAIMTVVILPGFGPIAETAIDAAAAMVS